MEQAQQHLAAALALGWTGVLGQHEASWARRWGDSDVVVVGDPAAQHALRFALYWATVADTMVTGLDPHTGLYE